MKRFFIFIAICCLFIGCDSNSTSQIADDNKLENNIINGGGSQWIEHYFGYFGFLASLTPLSSPTHQNTEVYFAIRESHLKVPEDKYDSIRTALGDTIRFLASDAYPFGGGFINDYEDIILTSDNDYEGIQAGQSLNYLVEFTYESVMPWFNETQHNTNGRRNPYISKIARNLNELKPDELNGCLMRCKLIFPSAPNKGQGFKFSFRGKKNNCSIDFTVPPEETDASEYYRYYFLGGF